MNRLRSAEPWVERKTEMHLDSIDKKLLNRMQVKFPLVPQPYEYLGMEFGITEDEAICRIGALRTDGTIRQIGPLFDAKKLDYRTTLVAMRVTGSELEKTIRLLADYPVSHAYERDHHFNLWFTLALPSSTDIDAELKKMFSSVRAEACFSLPALKLFKLRVYFSTGGDEAGEIADAPLAGNGAQEPGLSPLDRQVINEVQQDLALEPDPFNAMASRLGISETAFLDQCQSLLERGVMRRFSASVNHRKVGYEANSMACWAVPADKVDAAGQKLASLKEVSHCYERKTNSLWKYNLFAMIHSQTKEECKRIADCVASEIGLSDGILLFSTIEFKKTRLKYTV